MTRKLWLRFDEGAQEYGHLEENCCCVTIGIPSVFWPLTQGLRAAQQQCPSATQHSNEQNSGSAAASSAGAAREFSRSSITPAAMRMPFIHLCRRFVIGARYTTASLL